jgi:class 3 adenylate cyclase
MASLLGRGDGLHGYINFAVGAPFSYLSARQIIGWYQAGDTEKLSQLRDKTVLIGAILDNEDRVKLPVALAQWEPENRLSPGLVLQAQMLRSVLNQGLVQPVPGVFVLTMILVSAGFWFGGRFRLKVLCFGVFMLGFGAASLLALRATLFMPIGTVMVTGAVALLASSLLAGRRYWLERQYLTQTFSGYVSPQVLNGILSGALVAGQVGQRLQVCVLFSDIRDFTTLSEALPAERVVDLLNRYFDRMAHTIHRHGGLVDKFMGDGMMTLFGVPKTLQCPEMNALEAAREMLLDMDELNQEFRASGLPELRIGIGLNSGEAIIGHVGSKERHEYTAIGDAVNVAARVCDLPKVLGYPIVCTESVAKAVGFPEFLKDAGTQPIKGRADVRVFGWRPERGVQ